MEGRKPCRFFQLGNCRRGADCTYAHVQDPSFKRKPCEHHAKGRCWKGQDCKFSHAQEDIDASKRNAEASATTNKNGNKPSVSTTETQFRDWRQYISTAEGNGPRRSLGPAISKFCKEALELVNGDTGLVQEVVALLASEGGCRRVTEIVVQDFQALSAAQLSRVVDMQLLPFLQVITHENVLGSVILGPRLMTIYNIIYGGDGQRAATLFSALTKYLQTLSLTDADDSTTADERSVFALECTLAALDKLIEVNTEAQVHDGLKLVAETLDIVLEDPLPETSLFVFKTPRKLLRRIQQRLGLGQALPAGGGNRTTGDRATFELARERPGELSEDGARHDNDNVDIRQISILPTLEEIQSSRTEYLPLADPREWHLGGLEGLLDRHFRLLREDTVGQLRDAAKFELERLQNPQAHFNHAGRKPQGARTYVYENVTVSDIAFDSRGGMEFALSFDQPKQLARASERQRKDWWQASKRLSSDALICLISREGSATFFVVSGDRVGYNQDDTAVKTLHKRYNLSVDKERAHAIAKPIEQSDVFSMLDSIIGGDTQQLSLVEFPGVLLPAFKPTLQAMQTMSSTLDVPFSHILAPVSMPDDPAGVIDVDPPTYSTKPGFRYKLGSITTDGTPLDLDPARDVDDMAQELATRSSLDSGQARAVVSSLKHALALIQGPPGTGKSYTGTEVIKILLDNKQSATLGPIICVCFTNHALDQGLERLVSEGVKNIVRIGGSSKSERLADVNLRVLTQELELTKTEKHDRWSLTQKAIAETAEINSKLIELDRMGDQASVEKYLQRNNPDHFIQLFGDDDEDGWQEVNYHKGSTLDRWLKGAPWGNRTPRAIDELRYVHIWKTTGHERHLMHATWVHEIRADILDAIQLSIIEHSNIRAQLDLIRTELDLRVLRQANIIGITTSGLARHLDLIRRTGAKVLLCEEAGEVLESHLLTALVPSVEHAILIGDHQQLRPHIQNYELSSESKAGAQYSLDVSLFERLVQPRHIFAQPLPYCTLEVQRRMHPSISQLVRQTLYPRLQDAPAVAHYPEVMGVRKRLYWMHHEHPENEHKDSAISNSHTNDFEVDMTTSLIMHLVRQGVYKSDEIALITPYLGQLRKIRQKLRSTFNIVLNERDAEDLETDAEVQEVDTQTDAVIRRSSVARGTLLQTLRIATVDNFQGEEAKVIVVSLVRSNTKHNPGFLKTANRINVLLSRAKHGMYIIGNGVTPQGVKMWADVIEMFQQNGNFGTTLELCCPRHPDTPMHVKSPDDFVRISPEAGCDLACDKQLACGHSCVSKCHSELLHNSVHCMKPCTRPKDGCTHNCPLPCGDSCEKYCREPLDEELELVCGHVISPLCYQKQDPTKVDCKVQVEKDVPGCNHSVNEPCCVAVDDLNYKCRAPCNAELPCGHSCQKSCYECRNEEDGKVNIDHGSCRQQCGRSYTTCKHSCKASCHGEEPCPLCEQKCDVRCVHGACDKKCYEPCAPCAEACASHCPHSKCNMPCAAPCDSLPCAERCPKKLICGCQCPSLCGEPCPDVKFCQNCGPDDIKAMQADMIMFEPYGAIDLDEDPCIFTSCGHIFTRSSMDGIMDLAKFYEIDQMTGSVIALKDSSEPFSSDELKGCPSCRSSLRGLVRYGRIVRRALLDESVKRLTAWSHSTHATLADRLSTDQEKLIVSVNTAKGPNQVLRLKGSIPEQLQEIKRLTNSSRYRKTFATRIKIHDFVSKLGKDEQPYQRVRDLVETARRQNINKEIAEFQFSSSELQLREHLQATSLLIRCDVIILSDVIAMHSKTPAGRAKRPQIDFSQNRARCKLLSTEAKETHNVRQQATGLILWAHFAAMECGTFDAAAEDNEADAQQRFDALNKLGLEHLAEAEDICNSFTDKDSNPTAGLEDEINEVRRMLNEGVSISEMKMVVQAMAKEFGSTGHWYRCENGHPFTVGECGRPMQLARCPECGKGIGGQSHRPTEGVKDARDIEQRFGNLRL